MISQIKKVETELAMKKTVVIAAAGVGNRLGLKQPKCLVPVNGVPIFQYQLKAFEGFDEIRMVVGYKAEEVIDAVSAIRSDVIFIKNNDFHSTTTLQSMYLGARGLVGRVLFIDGDMILSRNTATKVFLACESGYEFIGVASDISEEPVYAGVEDDAVTWFGYDKKAEFEWANLACIDCSKLEYKKTHFFVQLAKFLPVKAIEIERLEVDTPSDFEVATTKIRDNPGKFYYGG